MSSEQSAVGLGLRRGCSAPAVSGEGDGTLAVRLREAMPPAAIRRFARLRVEMVSGFALIPAGTFTMGDYMDGITSALPLHSVTLPAFYMAKTLTTWAEWQKVLTWAMGSAIPLREWGADNHCLVFPS